MASHNSDLPCWTEEGIGWRPSYSPPARYHRSMRADMIVSEGRKLWVTAPSASLGTSVIWVYGYRSGGDPAAAVIAVKPVMILRAQALPRTQALLNLLTLLDSPTVLSLGSQLALLLVLCSLQADGIGHWHRS